MTEETTLYRAPFVVTGTGPVIENGGVLVRDDLIIAVDLFEHLKNEAAQIIDCDGHILTPALINCHAHLELSWMAEHQTSDDHFEPGDITGWIRGLLKKRDHFSPSDAEIDASARQALDILHANGTILVGDIGNRFESRLIGDGHKTTVLFYLEMMGLTKKAAQQQMSRLDKIDCSATGHGPYSSHPDLIKQLKRRADGRSDLLPLHVAETSDEVDLLQTGKGRFYDFLNERLQQIGEFEGHDLTDFFTVPGCGAVEYLDRLGVLGENTLCVHSVHVDAHEIDLLAQKGAKVCLCPLSNRFIGVGIAPLEVFLDKGILPGLGTDSLVSNRSLNIFAEMSALAEDHPQVDPATIFMMATIGGARALNSSKQYGSIEKGKRAAMLAIECDSIDSKAIYQFLVHGGEELQVKWLEAFRE
nr:amidohydrolase family protein [Desulfobulbaceae bacterium]